MMQISNTDVKNGIAILGKPQSNRGGDGLSRWSTLNQHGDEAVPAPPTIN